MSQHASAEADAGPIGSGRLRRQDFARLAAFIEDYSGIKMPPTKITMVEGRLQRRVRATGMRESGAILPLPVRGGRPGRGERASDRRRHHQQDRLLPRAGHFRFLRELVLPDLLRRTPRGSRRNFRCGAPRARPARNPTRWPWCSPNSPARLPRCRQASSPRTSAPRCSRWHSAASTRKTSSSRWPLRCARYLLRSRDRARRLVRIVPRLRAMVRFARLNLMDATYTKSTPGST